MLEYVAVGRQRAGEIALALTLGGAGGCSMVARELSHPLLAYQLPIVSVVFYFTAFNVYGDLGIETTVIHTTFKIPKSLQFS